MQSSESTLYFMGCVPTLQPNPGNGIDDIILAFNKDICKAYDESNFPWRMQISKEELVPETKFTENKKGEKGC